MVGASVLFLALGIFLYFKLQKAEVDIWPKTEILSFNQQITADKTVASVDLENNLIPVQILQEEKESWQEFDATGIALTDSKAGGIITVFNSYEPASPISLKAGTHFLSDSGKYFVSLQKITIPAAKTSGGKVVPGSVTVKVEAEEAGDGYNIGPAKFSVPKLSGTAYYYSVFASSSASMSGGYSKNVKKVTDDDIQNAKDTLVEKLSEDVVNSLKSKLSSDDILLDNAISTDVVNASSVIKEGAAIDKFNYQVKISVTALAFKKQDLEDLAKKYIVSQISDSETFLDESFVMNYTSDRVDIDGGKIIMNSDFSAKVYQKIDKDNLGSLFAHKTRDEITAIITDNLGENVSRVKVNFWPFWVQKAPSGENKINIDLDFE
jgi:hypothetical protein